MVCIQYTISMSDSRVINVTFFNISDSMRNAVIQIDFCALNGNGTPMEPPLLTPKFPMKATPVKKLHAARWWIWPVKWGVYVTNVAANSPASQAGLQQGDIITQVDNVVMDETHSCLNTLYAHKPDDQVTLYII
jgi:S1-C subfamily serine protease